METVIGVETVLRKWSQERETHDNSVGGTLEAQREGRCSVSIGGISVSTLTTLHSVTRPDKLEREFKEMN